MYKPESQDDNDQEINVGTKRPQGTGGLLDALSRFESAIESIVEDSLLNSLHARGHPIEIAKRLTRVMGDEACVWSDGRLVAPDKYVVQLRPMSYDVYNNILKIMEQDLAEYLQNAARDNEPTIYFLESPVVRLESGHYMGRRRVLVRAHWGEDDRKGGEASPQTEQKVKAREERPATPEAGFSRLTQESLLPESVQLFGRHIENPLKAKDPHKVIARITQQVQSGRIKPWQLITDADFLLQTAGEEGREKVQPFLQEAVRRAPEGVMQVALIDRLTALYNKDKKTHREGDAIRRYMQMGKDLGVTGKLEGQRFFDALKGKYPESILAQKEIASFFAGINPLPAAAAEQAVLKHADRTLSYLEACFVPDTNGRFKETFNFHKFWKDSRQLQQNHIGGIPVLLVPEVSHLYAKLGRDKRLWEGVFEEVIKTTNLARKRNNPSDLVKEAKIGLGIAVVLGMNQDTQDPDLQPVKKVIDDLIGIYGTDNEFNRQASTEGNQLALIEPPIEQDTPRIELPEAPVDELELQVQNPVAQPDLEKKDSRIIEAQIFLS